MKPLLAEQLANDPRIAAARRMILEALAEAQSQIRTASPPATARVAQYQKQLDHFTALRGGKLFYPYLGSGLGRGPLVELADGSIKYDMITGIGVHALGHADPQLIDALLIASTQDLVMQGNLQQNLEATSLTERFTTLAQAAGADLPHCFLTTSGAMANENALKLLFAAKPGATRILAFERCFMGRTFALASITGRPEYRPGLPAALPVDYVPFIDIEHPERSTSQALLALEAHLRRYPHQHAGMCMELVQGEAGYYPGTPAFFLALIELLEAHHIPVFIDEIQTFARTTRPFAFDHFHLAPHVDVVTLGKLTQVCATLFSGDLLPPPGLISQTFTAATSALRAAMVILDRLDHCDLFGDRGRIATLHARFVDNLTAIDKQYPHTITGPFGIGGMIALRYRTGNADDTRQFLHRLFDAGVIAFIAGDHPARVRMLPPLAVMNEAHVDTVTDIIGRVVKDTWQPARGE